MPATLAPGILPALVSRCFSIQDVSADRCPSLALAQPDSNTRSNGTIRVIPFRIKRLSTRRSDRPSGAHRPCSRDLNRIGLPCQATYAEVVVQFDCTTTTADQLSRNSIQPTANVLSLTSR